MNQWLEKQDVDVSKLFNWSKKVEIKDDKDVTIIEAYVRIIGDAELGRCRVYGLRKSAEMRKKLMDFDSDERVAYIGDISTFTKDRLIDLILVQTMKELSAEARKNKIGRAHV
jgi:hypothetical protein